MATAAELVKAGADDLAAAGIDGARLDAEVLLRHLLGINRTTLFARLREPVDSTTESEFAALIERRKLREPVAYLTGEREFMGLPFAVGPGVLVPRPETEFIVEWATTWLKGRSRSTVVDVGTGSGAIILSLASQMSAERGDQFIGVDRSQAAIGYARANRDRLSLSARVQLVLADLTEALRAADLILANLPYLTPVQVESNPDLAAEPAEALISGADGLTAIARLIDDLPRILKTGGAAVFELDPSQATAAASILRKQKSGFRVTIVQDLAGSERFVVAETA